MLHGKYEPGHEEDKGEQGMLFNELPEEALVSLLRRTSARPRSEHWVAYLDTETVLNVCESGGALGDLARRSVPALAIPSVHGIVDNEITCFVEDHSTNFPHACNTQIDNASLKVDVTTERGRRTFKGLVKQLGLHLRTLILNFSYIWANQVPLAHQCANLEALVLYDKYTEFDLPALLLSCRGKLRNLDLGGDFLPPRYIDGIAAHCKGLRKLGLKFGEIGAPMLPLWERVGPTLKELCFGKPADQCEFPESTFLSYGDMRRLCVVLETLEVRDIGFGTMAVPAITKFGRQLKRLKMMACESCMRPEQLRIIFESCRADIAVEAFVYSNIVHTLGALAHRAQVLKVNYDEVEEGLDQAANGCTNVNELDVRVATDYADYFLTQFLSTPKPSLRKVNIVVDGYIQMNREDNMFNKLAETVDTIESMSCFVYCISRGVFAKFAEKNKNIRSVDVSCGRSSWEAHEPDLNEGDDGNGEDNTTMAEDAAVSFITDFSRCTELKELVLNDELLEERSHRIEETIKASNLRGKSIDVVIGGIQYNP